MFQFFESIKIKDGKVHLLELHQQRIDTSLLHFKGEKIPKLESIFSELNVAQMCWSKARFSYDCYGGHELVISSYQPKKIEQFRLIEAPSIDYSFKYENRNALQLLKNQCSDAEILITKNGQLTDSSIANLIFFKNEQWYTPITYLLNGVQRQSLLARGFLKSTNINIMNINTFSHFKTINALMDFEDAFCYPIEMIR